MRKLGLIIGGLFLLSLIGCSSMGSGSTSGGPGQGSTAGGAGGGSTSGGMGGGAGAGR